MASMRSCVALLLAGVGCGGSLDAGWDEPKNPLLPVDNRNPVLLCNDGAYDNWQGEYALLMASKGTLSLAGIVISTSPNSSNLSDNFAGWQAMVDAARRSGLNNIPDPKASKGGGANLVRPSDGKIDSTVPNNSDGAQFINNKSNELSHPYRPLVVVTGGRLTDVADAYLMDPTLADRIVVVASLGSATKDGGAMGIPNGEMDTWADVIVAQRLRYVQVSAFYDQTADLPTSLLPQLPTNQFTSWMKAKQTQVFNDVKAADQVGVVAVGIPTFVSARSKVVQRGVDSNNIPTLAGDGNGPICLVSEIKGALATAWLAEMLLAPTTFSP
jgi:hypothetical protein